MAAHSSNSPGKGSAGLLNKPISKSDDRINRESLQNRTSTKLQQGSILSRSMHSIESAAAQMSPPDGGFGWVVVFGSFMIHVVADGITYAYGALVPTLLEEFNEGESITAAVGGTLFGVTLVVGPIVAALVNRFGCRPITCLGAVIATVGTIISMFSTSISFMLLTFGVITGFGFGLIYLPAIVSVTQWFEKKRSFATGIAVCGSGVGTMLFSPISSALIEVYSWQGAFLILAGVIFNCAVFGALFRPVEYGQIAIAAEHNVQEDSQTKKEVSRAMKGSVSSLEDANHLAVGRGALGINAKSDTHIHVQKTGSKDRTSNGMLRKADSHGGKSHERSHLKLASIDANGEISEITDVTIPPLARKDALYTGSLSNIALYRQNPGEYKASVLDLHKAVDEADQMPEKKQGWAKKANALVKDLLDPSLFLDWVFIYFTVSNFFTSIAFQVPYVFLPDHAMHIGIDKDRAPFLLSVIGLANIFGRIGFGLLADRPNINKLWLYNAAVTLAGLAMIATVWCPDFWSNAVCAAIFGVFIGAFVTLTPVLLVELFGLERLTNAFGNLLLFQGLATFLGPPIGGKLKEISGTYDNTFVVFGIMMAASGAMLFIIPCLRRWESSYKGKSGSRNGVNPVSTTDTRGRPETVPLMVVTEANSPKTDPLPAISVNGRRINPADEEIMVA